MSKAMEKPEADRHWAAKENFYSEIISDWYLVKTIVNPNASFNPDFAVEIYSEKKMLQTQAFA